jgi:hypothetical protein
VQEQRVLGNNVAQQEELKRGFRFVQINNGYMVSLSWNRMILKKVEQPFRETTI